MNLDTFIGTPGSLTSGRTFKKVLLDTYNLISDENRWAQGCLAAATDGRAVKPRDPRAHCWCLTGAIAYCSNELGIVSPELLEWLDKLTSYHFPGKFGSVERMNDYMDHQHVLAFLQDAIGRLPD